MTDILRSVEGELLGLDGQHNLVMRGTKIITHHNASPKTERTIEVMADGSLQINGVPFSGSGGGVTVATVAANSTVSTSNSVTLVNAVGGSRTIALAAAAALQNVTIKKTDASANAVVIDPNAAETIDGNTTISLTNQYESVTLVSDGSNWFIV